MPSSQPDGVALQTVGKLAALENGLAVDGFKAATCHPERPRFAGRRSETPVRVGLHSGDGRGRDGDLLWPADKTAWLRVSANQYAILLQTTDMPDITEVACYVASISRAEDPVTTPIFKLGGNPVFVSHIEQPACKHCGQNMDFIGQIRLDSPLQLSNRYQMAYVFMCLGQLDERGWLVCPTWESFSGANMVLLQMDRGLALVPGTDARYPDYRVALAATPEAAHADKADFPDGVWWIELAPLADPDCAARIAFTLGMQVGLDSQRPKKALAGVLRASHRRLRRTWRYLAERLPAPPHPGQQP